MLITILIVSMQETMNGRKSFKPSCKKTHSYKGLNTFYLNSLSGQNEITKDGLNITGKPLSFVHVHLSLEDLISTQIILAHHVQDEALFQRIIEHADSYSPSSRIGLLNIYCLVPVTEGQREFYLIHYGIAVPSIVLLR